MKKVIKEYNVFKFEELEEKIKEQLINERIKLEHEFYIDYELEEDMEKLAKELLEEHFKNAIFDRVYYDLSYSQGSGCMIRFHIDLKDLNNKYKILKEEELNDLENFGGTQVRVYHKGNYYHEFSYVVDYNDFTCFDYEWRNIENIEKTQDKIIEMIQEFEKDIIKMNKLLTKKGYNLIEDKRNYRELALINLNEKEFLENGEEFYY